MILPFQMTEAAARVAEKAVYMEKVDPHGFTLTIVSVSLVFFVLFILFVAYSISGGIFTKKDKVKKQADTNVLEKNEPECEVVAAIAAAIHLYLNADETHDWEPGIITINR